MKLHAFLWLCRRECHFENFHLNSVRHHFFSKIKEEDKKQSKSCSNHLVNNSLSYTFFCLSLSVSLSVFISLFDHWQSDEYLTTLTCFYDWRGEPYLRLMPAKVERHHWNPELLTFHHVLSDGEITHIQQLAQPMVSKQSLGHLLSLAKPRP